MLRQEEARHVRANYKLQGKNGKQKQRKGIGCFAENKLNKRLGLECPLAKQRIHLLTGNTRREARQLSIQLFQTLAMNAPGD